MALVPLPQSLTGVSFRKILEAEDENQPQTQHYLKPDLEVKPRPSSVVIDKFSYYLALPPHTIYPKYNCSRIVCGEDFSKCAFVLYDLDATGCEEACMTNSDLIHPNVISRCQTKKLQSLTLK